MAKKKVEKEILPPAPIEIGEISDVVETNYMPYAMSVIVSRAIPEIDGFKPSHRKLLYTMYKMGLMTGQTTKCAKVAGATMNLNPHGDASIYETLVRLTTARESLLHPFIESKGTFGKQYSDLPYAASRYTECKLDKFCETIFDGIDKDAVDFTDSYDHTSTEPVLLPTAFPNVLVSPNSGIAVGLASRICSFNLAEICDLTTLYLKKGEVSDDELIDTLKAPDFSTGAYIIYDRAKMLSIYKSGEGTFKLRSKYTYDKAENRILITEIPYTTTAEKIKDSVVKLIKDGKIKDIADIRNETGLQGLRLAIDLKRGADQEKLMAKLFRSTQLEDTFACNFTILIGGSPKTLGVMDILDEWCAFRIECLRRTFIYDCGKKKDKLHLLYGLKEILLDIDKAVRIVRSTELEADVVPNLMKGFGIDEIQAEYVADIKLRYMNREYILKRIDEIDDLEKDIADLEELINSDKRIKSVIIKQLADIKKKYGKPRKTFLIFGDDLVTDVDIAEEHEEFPVVAFLSVEGYFKKCLPSSLRISDVQKYKENDSLRMSVETTNCSEVLFFTTSAQVYKAHLYDFDATKASLLGDYIPAALGMDADERVVSMLCLSDYDGDIVLFFENGKGVCIPLESYKTVTNRKRLTKAFYGGSKLVAVFKANQCGEYLLRTSACRALLVGEKQIVRKTTRTSSGSQLITLKKDALVVSAEQYDPASKPLAKESKYRKSSLPASGAIFEDFDPDILQQTLTD